MVLLMAFVTLLPVQGLAQDDAGLERAIRAVKAKIEVPIVLPSLITTLTARVIKSVGTRLDQQGQAGGNTSVRVDDKGDILSYNFYKPYDYGQHQEISQDKQAGSPGHSGGLHKQDEAGAGFGIETGGRQRTAAVGRYTALTI